MTTCPVKHKLRPDLPPLPKRIANLPVDARGYPVPYFVAWIDGKPDFRMSDAAKWVECVKYQKCWVCGQTLGTFKAFILGPMCCITRTTSEPPMHLECAQWTVLGCPFLSKPQMTRRKDELIEANKVNVAGEMIERNPGASAIWVTKDYKLFKDRKGKPLITVGEPTHVSWWRLGRSATRAEVMESVQSGYPLLEKTCKGDPEELKALKEAVMKAMAYLPERRRVGR